jgi:hypothetical protein
MSRLNVVFVQALCEDEGGYLVEPRTQDQLEYKIVLLLLMLLNA